jgi:hypothetical protein
MLVVDLHCAHGHHFEGWFASADDLASQKVHGLLTCPVCGDHEVTRRPSAPHLNTSGLKERTPSMPRSHQAPAPAPVVPVSASNRPVDRPAQGELPAQAQDAVAALQALYLRAVRHVLEHTEDVGETFVDEVRSIHHGDAPQRAIRGHASEADKQALQEEGIDIVSMPIPEGFNGPLQ